MGPPPDLRPRLRWALMFAAPAVLMAAVSVQVTAGRLAGPAPMSHVWFEDVAEAKPPPCPRELTHRGNLRLLVYLPWCEGPPQYRGPL